MNKSLHSLEARRVSKAMPRNMGLSRQRKVYCAIGTMSNKSGKYALTTKVNPKGVQVYVNDYKLDLNKAPQNEHGTVEVLELRPDHMVWASGTLFFDPSKGTYFPKEGEEEEEEEERAPLKRTRKSKKNPVKTRTKRRRKGSNPAKPSKPSVTVTIF